jgi:hypothetical protein
MTSRTSPLRLVAGEARAPVPAGLALATRRALWILGPLAALLIFAVVFLRAGDQERALRSLPPAERAALYHRTLDNLRSVCAGEGKYELRDLCRGQAQLALLFPECDAACRATAREQLRVPTR